jgi:hypothetical protein
MKANWKDPRLNKPTPNTHVLVCDANGVVSVGAMTPSGQWVTAYCGSNVVGWDELPEAPISKTKYETPETTKGK